MKYGVFAMMAALLAGCGVEMLTATATQSVVQAQQAQAVRGQVRNASEQMGRVNLEKAIQTYRAEKGVNPPTLDVLAPDYIPAVPVHADGTPYGYNAATGALLDGPAAPDTTAKDAQTLKAIQDAIQRYGTAVGYYPPTLDALYPVYLAQLPRTAAGEAFLYNNQNGEVRHPRGTAAPAAAPAQAAGAAVPMGGGAGPMGEVMTGVGMQQQLNGMSSAGSSAAQGYMNRQTGSITGGHNDQQNQVMDNLGL